MVNIVNEVSLLSIINTTHIKTLSWFVIMLKGHKNIFSRYFQLYANEEVNIVGLDFDYCNSSSN